MQKSKKTHLKNMCSPIKYNFCILYYSCKKHFLCPLQSPHNSFHFHFHIFSLQVQRFLHDILLDQLSPLVELKFWLAKLAVSNPPVNTRRPLLLEVVPQVISLQIAIIYCCLFIYKSKLTDFKYCYLNFISCTVTFVSSQPCAWHNVTFIVTPWPLSCCMPPTSGWADCITDQYVATSKSGNSSQSKDRQNR